MLNAILKHFATTLLAAFPPRWRFPIAQRLAWWLHPVLRWKGQFEKYQPSLHGPRERALLLFVINLIRRDIDFESRLEIQSAELLKDSGGVLLLTAHFMLNRLLLRWLCDHGRQVSVITVSDSLNEIVGRHYPIELIYPDARSYLHIRQQVRTGRVVYLTPETPNPIANAHQMQLGGENFYVSDHALRFAERAHIPVLFAATRVSAQGKVIVKLARPSTTRVDVAFAEFCQFITTEVEQMQARSLA